MVKDVAEQKAIETTKQRALDYFVKGLLKTDAKDSIARILLFGSLLKKEVKRESDIDVLVVACDSLMEVSHACADASFETAMATGEGVEPLVRCIDEIRFPRSYFLHSISKKGREVYRMEAEELKRKECRNYVELASEYLDGSRFAYRNGYLRIAVDSGYNACELLIKALLLMKLPDIPGSHGGIVGKFGELYVKTGDLPKDLGRAIGLALEKRNNARYEPHAEITKKQAEEILNLGEKLRDILEKKIHEL